jgi:hypothetical protein
MGGRGERERLADIREALRRKEAKRRERVEGWLVREPERKA